MGEVNGAEDDGDHEVTRPSVLVDALKVVADEVDAEVEEPWLIYIVSTR
jgi:hypothetical protein